MSKAQAAKSANVQNFSYGGTMVSERLRRATFQFASSIWESRDEEVRAKEQRKQRVARPQSEEAIMKCTILQFATGLALFAALSTSFPLCAQTEAGPSHYVVIDLGTLGGTDAGGSSINNRGWVTGM